MAQAASLTPLDIGVPDIGQATLTRLTYDFQIYGTPVAHGQAVLMDGQDQRIAYGFDMHGTANGMIMVGQPVYALTSSGASVNVTGVTVDWDVSYGTNSISSASGVGYGLMGQLMGQAIYTADSNGNPIFTMTPDAQRSRRCLSIVEGPEEVARGLLKRMVGERAFRNYIRNGFISYRGKSGKVYQIYPGSQMTKVWQDGRPLKTLCVVFQDKDIPPTDWVIMRMLMLEHDEQAFWALANKFDFYRSTPSVVTAAPAAGRILQMAMQRRALGLRGPLQRTIGQDGLILRSA